MDNPQRSNLPTNFILSDEYAAVDRLITSSLGEIILVSGKAGTGKSVLVDYIDEKHQALNIIKVGPTGVSAININGATLHSTFKLPSEVMTPNKIRQHIQSLAANHKMRDTITAMMKGIHILIIDEISMVRADVLDAVDRILRAFRSTNEPFGGVNTLMVGDLMQLSPVVTKYDMDEFEMCGYDTQYFFSSRVIEECINRSKIKFIELKTVRRQNDDTFLQLLHNIRVRQNLDFTLQVINGACYHHKQPIDRETITVCSTNALASDINSSQLDKLTGTKHTYFGSLFGNFRRESVLSPDELILKQHARVMFTKNDPERRWVNGTLGTVTGVDQSGWPLVLIDGERDPIPVQEVTWEIAKYVVKDVNDDGKQVIEKEVIGSYTQVPLMLAWAVTTHKTQGLTFDNININFGNGAFASGQAYVAFSRCRTIQGIRLERPLLASDIIIDPIIIKFFDIIDLFDCTEYLRSTNQNGDS